MIKIDGKELAFYTIGEKTKKKILTETVKNAIRNNNYILTSKDYCSISLSNDTRKHYYKDNKEIKLDTTTIIENYCKENSIDIIEVTKENYKVEIIPSELAYKKYNKMLDIIENNAPKTLTKTTSKMKNRIKYIQKRRVK